jgi:predicted AlkP superfamily pyrophosphatase or phosphodiesterase
LISLDGFRWDFLERGATPTLLRLAQEGVRADRLIPSFPTKTFPNHYTIVTGLRPAEHGLVANNIFDPATGERFSLSDRSAVADGKWYGGEPIWVTAERAGLRTAPLFWPGSEAEILGVRPTFHRPYDGSMSPQGRVDLMLEWLDLPADQRPAFMTLYFETVDSSAHRYGPAPSDELAQALGTVDRAVAHLVAGLEQRGLASSVDLVIVSDHGMSATSADRLIFLDDYLDPVSANVVDWTPILGLWPSMENLEPVYHALKGAHPHLEVYRREEIPERYRFSGHERIPPILGISDDGWSVTTRSHLEGCPTCFDGGTHGYDQRLDSMGGLLIARGPSFRRHTTIAPIENHHLYNVFCAVLGLRPALNSGDPDQVSALLSDTATAKARDLP